jgi:sodium/bile acid cotransporter 7
MSRRCWGSCARDSHPERGAGQATGPMKFKPDGFLLGMVLVTVLAWAFPEPGAKGGWLHPEILTKAGIALLFYLNGAGLSFAALRAGALNWRLHALVQACTFVMFPLLGLGLWAVLSGRISSELILGIFFLCALPSTVASSIAMTATARGNVAGAVFNATLSSLLGVVLTPLWIALVLKTSGQSQPLGPVILNLIRWLVLPLVLGQLSRPWLADWIRRRKPWIGLVDRGTILLLVYTSFCESFAQGIWSGQGVGQLTFLVVLCGALLSLVLLLTAGAARLLGFARADRITAIFCGSKKTLAAGVPMARLIFGAHPGIALILLPIMIYHSLQLVVGGLLAQRWGAADDEAGG